MRRVASALVLLAGVVAVLVMAAALFAVVGRGGSGGEEQDSAVARDQTTTTRPAPAPAGVDATAGAKLPGPSSGRLRPVDGTLHALPPDRLPSAYDVVDRLADGEVRLLAAVGFQGGDGAAALCALTAAGPGDCGPAVPVRFDDGGRARFLFQFGTRVETPAGATVDCAAASARCALVVTSPGPAGVAPAVFGGPAPAPGRVTVEPARGLRAGQVVTVVLAGFPPSARAVVTECVPSAGEPPRCGAPAAVVPVAFDGEGRATVRYRVRTGPTDRDGADSCRRGRPCGIAVVGEGLFARAPAATVTFAGHPAARYDAGRLATGSALALVLLGAAAWLVRRTDWSPVGTAVAADEA